MAQARSGASIGRPPTIVIRSGRPAGRESLIPWGAPLRMRTNQLSTSSTARRETIKVAPRFRDFPRIGA
jgi:hypothetical protein